MFKKYNIVLISLDTEYLCKHKDWKIRPRIYFSKYESSKEERIKFTILGAYWKKFIIWILASDLKIDIRECSKW